MARPTEIKAVAAAISEPAETAQEAAKRAIQALDDSRLDRTDYLVIAQAGRFVQGYGLYPTYKKAADAIEKQQIRGVDGTRFFVVPVIHPKAHARQIEEADAPALSEDAIRMWEISRNGGQAAKTHSRRNRRRSA